MNYRSHMDKVHFESYGLELLTFLIVFCFICIVASCRSEVTGALV